MFKPKLHKHYNFPLWLSNGLGRVHFHTDPGDLGGDDPTAGGTAGLGGDGAGGTGGGTPSANPFENVSFGDVSKHFQADIDRIVQERLSRQERQYQQEMERIQQEYEEMLGQFEPEDNSEFDDPFAPFEERISSIEEHLENMELEKQISELSGKYPDFKDNEEAILETALELQTDNLLAAYAYWKHHNFDEAAFKENAIKEYLAGKKTLHEQTPLPEAGGGSAPSAGKQIKTFDDADKATRARFGIR